MGTLSRLLFTFAANTKVHFRLDFIMEAITMNHDKTAQIKVSKKSGIFVKRSRFQIPQESDILKFCGYGSFLCMH